MIHKGELTKAVVQNNAAQNKRKSTFARIANLMGSLSKQVEQLDKQDEADFERMEELLKDISNLQAKVHGLQKELMEQTMRANRLEGELQQQVKRNQEKQKVFISYRWPEEANVAADEPEDEKPQERAIMMSTVVSFGATRMTQEAVQTLVDLLHFALDDRTPEEDEAIRKMMADFRSEQRPQMNVTDSTQNFFLK